MTTTDIRTKPSQLCFRAVEFRAAAPDATTDGRTLEGYAAVFDSPTEIDSWEGCFSEAIARGAFKRTINAQTPVLQFDHGRDARTGSVPIGAIQTLREDATGLFVSARLFDNDVVEPIRQAIEGGAINGMSFRFQVVRDSWTDAKGVPVEGTELLDLLWAPGDRGPLVRTILEVKLFELGPVVFPAYAETSVGVRSMIASLPEGERAALVRELVGMRDAPTETPDAPADTPPDEPAAPAAPEPPEPASRTSEPQTEPADPGTSAPSTSTSTERTHVMDLMTVEERASRQTEISARLKEIDNEHAGATLPDAVQTEWDTLRSEFATHADAITAQEARRAELAVIAERTGGEKAEGNGFVRGRGYAGSPAVHTSKDIFDLAAVRQAARSPEEASSLYRDNARRAIELATFPGSEDRAKAQEVAERTLVKHDDETGTLARRMLVTGSPLYMRGFGKLVASLSDRGLTTEERTALSLGTDAQGGYAVPFQLDPTVILTSNGAINPLRDIARVERIIGKEWDGITSAGVTVSRGAEAAEAADNGPSLAQPTVRANRVQGFIPFSFEIEQDWSQLLSEMNVLLADAKDVEEASSFTLGDGTGTNAGGVVTTLTAGQEVAVSTAAGGFKVPDTLDAIVEALPPRFRARGQWLANVSVYNKIGALAAAAGYALDPWVSLVNAKPSGLIGYPKNEASSMTSDITTAGDRYLVFGDFKQFLIVDRIGMTIEVIPQLFGASGRPTGQRGIYAIWRNNSKVLVPGAFRTAKAAA